MPILRFANILLMIFIFLTYLCFTPLLIYLLSEKCLCNSILWMSLSRILFIWKYLFSLIYLREGGREIEKSSTFYLLVHFLNAATTGHRNSMWVSRDCGRYPSSWVLIYCLPETLAAKWIEMEWKWSPSHEMGFYFYMGHRHSRAMVWSVTAPEDLLGFFLFSLIEFISEAIWAEILCVMANIENSIFIFLP